MAEENSKTERDTVMDLSLYYQKGQRESDWKSILFGFQSTEIKRKGIFLWCLNIEIRRKIISPGN